MFVTERILHVGGEVREDLSGSLRVSCLKRESHMYQMYHHTAVSAQGAQGYKWAVGSRGCIFIIFHL